MGLFQTLTRWNDGMQAHPSPRSGLPSRLDGPDTFTALMWLYFSELRCKNDWESCWLSCQHGWTSCHLTQILYKLSSQQTGVAIVAAKNTAQHISIQLYNHIYILFCIELDYQGPLSSYKAKRLGHAFGMNWGTQLVHTSDIGLGVRREAFLVLRNVRRAFKRGDCFLASNLASRNRRHAKRGWSAYFLKHHLSAKVLQWPVWPQG